MCLIFRTPPKTCEFYECTQSRHIMVSDTLLLRMKNERYWAGVDALKVRHWFFCSVCLIFQTPPKTWELNGPLPKLLNLSYVRKPGTSCSSGWRMRDIEPGGDALKVSVFDFLCSVSFEFNVCVHANHILLLRMKNERYWAGWRCVEGQCVWFSLLSEFWI